MKSYPIQPRVLFVNKDKQTRKNFIEDLKEKCLVTAVPNLTLAIASLSASEPFDCFICPLYLEEFTAFECKMFLEKHGLLSYTTFAIFNQFKTPELEALTFLNNMCLLTQLSSAEEKWEELMNCFKQQNNNWLTNTP